MEDTNSPPNRPSKKPPAVVTAPRLFVALVVVAFGVSYVGDFYFETPWINRYWYLFEFAVWGGAIALFSLIVGLLANTNRSD